MRSGRWKGRGVREMWDAIERKEIDRFGRSLARRIREDPWVFHRVMLQDVCQVTTASETFPDLDLEGVNP